MSSKKFSRTVRGSALAVVAATVAVTLLGCSGESNASSSSSGESTDFGDISVQLTWIKNEEFAGEYFADSKGYFKDAGFDSVNLVAGPSTGSAELLSGSADIALSESVSVGSVISNEGAPLKVIGATFQSNPFTMISLAAGSNITTPQQLIGKRIGVQASNTSLFDAFLAVNDIDVNDVTVVPIGYDPSVLVNGDVDAMIGYQTNEAVTVAAGGNQVTLLNFADNGLPYVTDTITVTDQTIAEHRDMLKAFLTALIRGWSDAVNDPTGAAKLAVDTYGSDLGLNLATSTAGAEAQAKLIVSADTEKNGLLLVSDQLQKDTVASLKAAGVDISTDQLFDMSLLDEVYAEHPELVKYSR